MTRIRRQQTDRSGILESLKLYLPRNDFVRLDYSQFQRSFRLINALIPWFRRCHTCSHEYIDSDISLDSISDLNPTNPKLLTIRKGMDLTTDLWDAKWKKIENTFDTILTKANLPDFSKRKIKKQITKSSPPQLSVMSSFIAGGFIHRNLLGDDFCEVEEMYKFPPKHNLRCLWIGHLTNIVLKDIEHPSVGFRLGKWYAKRGYYVFAMPCFEVTLTRFTNLSYHWFSNLFNFAQSYDFNLIALHEIFLNSRPLDYFISPEFYSLEKYFQENSSLSNQVTWLYYRIFSIRSLLGCLQDTYPHEISLSELNSILEQNIPSILSQALNCYKLIPQLSSPDKEKLIELIYSEIVLINCYCLNLKAKNIYMFANPMFLLSILSYLFALQNPTLDWKEICQIPHSEVAPLPDLLEKCSVLYHRVDIRPSLEQIFDQFVSQISWEHHWEIVEKLTLVPIQRRTGWIIHFNLNVLSKLMKRFDVKAVRSYKKSSNTTFTLEKFSDMDRLFKKLSLRQDSLRTNNPTWAVSPQKRRGIDDLDEPVPMDQLCSQLKKRQVPMNLFNSSLPFDELGISLQSNFDPKGPLNICTRSPLPVRQCRMNKLPIYEDPDEEEYSDSDLLPTLLDSQTPFTEVIENSSLISIRNSAHNNADTFENEIDPDHSDISISDSIQENSQISITESQANSRSLPIRKCRLNQPGVYNEDALLEKALPIDLESSTTKSHKNNSQDTESRRQISIHNLITRYQHADENISLHQSVATNKENDFQLPVRECRKKRPISYNENLTMELVFRLGVKVPTTNEAQQFNISSQHDSNMDTDDFQQESMIKTPPGSHHSPIDSPPQISSSQSANVCYSSKKRKLSPSTTIQTRSKTYSPNSPASTSNGSSYSQRLRKRIPISYNEEQAFKSVSQVKDNPSKNIRPQAAHTLRKNRRNQPSHCYNEDLAFAKMFQ